MFGGMAPGLLRLALGLQAAGGDGGGDLGSRIVGGQPASPKQFAALVKNTTP